MPLIAIDGPGGSGKSSVARKLAHRLGIGYLDSGGLYRCVALAALQKNLDLTNPEAMTKLATESVVEIGELVSESLPLTFSIDGDDVTATIRSSAVSAAASQVAVHPGLRVAIIRQLQQWVERHGHGVVEGRDIGRVVCPQADLKIYLTADLGERARRRSAAEKGQAIAADETKEQLAWRDINDSSRSVDPLEVPKDAVMIDTTNLTIEEVADQIIQCL